jgi:HK97 family phage prohead protease
MDGPGMTTRAAAAAARALKMPALASRPSQRMAERSIVESRGCTPALRSRIEIREAGNDSSTVRFEGFASVTGQPYVMYDMFGEYDEIVSLDAFDETLGRDGLDVPLVLDHVSSKRIARTGNAVSPLELSVVKEGETTGLMTVAPSVQLSDPDAAYIVPKLRSGLIDEMSFRFTIDAGRWNDEFTVYTIQRVNLHRGDVAIVGYGANPLTAGSGLRDLDKPRLSDRDRVLFELDRDHDDKYADLMASLR